MSWRYTKAGKSFSRPSSEQGLYIEGPLTAADWKVILEDITEELIEQAKREAQEVK